MILQTIRATQNALNKPKTPKDIAMSVYGTMDPIGNNPNVTRTKPVQPPTYSPSFKPQQMSTLGDADAITKARAIQQPMYEQERTNAGVIAQQQGDMLAQNLNARGLLGGGNEVQGRLNLAAGLQKALADNDTNYNAQSMQLAEQLKQARLQEINDSFQRQYQTHNVNEDARRFDVNQDYKVGRDAVLDKQFADELNAKALERAWRQREGLANMWGVDPVTGRPTQEKVNADRNYDINKWLKESQIRENQAQTARALRPPGTPGRRSGSGGSSSSKSVDITKGVNQKSLGKADLYIDGLKDQVVKDGVVASKGVGVKTKQALKVELREGLNRYSGSGGFAKFQAEIPYIYKRQPDTADFLVKAIYKAFGVSD